MQANLTGKDRTNYDIMNNKITFIADSGATHHIIQKGFLLQNFQKSNNETIRSANKNKSANIIIDGRGNLLLKTNSDEIIKLTNVLAAKNISNNLLSLRMFADAGLGIYLDSSELKIFDKNTGIACLTGTYRKPNWLLKLEVEEEKQEDKQPEIYSCEAKLVSVQEFMNQSQTDIQDLQNLDENKPEDPSEIGREKRYEQTNVPGEENLHESAGTQKDIESEENIIDLENLSLEEDKWLKETENEKTSSEVKKIDE